MDHVSHLYILAGPWKLVSFASKNRVKREIPKYLKVLCWLFFFFFLPPPPSRLGMLLEGDIIKMVFLISVGMWEASWGLARWWLLTVWSKVGIVLIARCYPQGSGNGFSSRNLWLWLINHGVPRNEIDRQPIKVCLDLFNQSYSRSDEQRPHWSQGARELGVHRPCAGEAGACEERSCCNSTQACCESLLCPS